MDRPTFFDRRPLGIPNYLAIALAVVMVIAFVPRGARKALNSNTNNVEDWLPASYTESTELKWFRKQFGSEAFVLVSWDGCTLGDSAKLELLANRLRAEPLTPELAQLAGVTPHPDRRMFTRVTTGPELVEQLMDAPARLERSAAIARIEGAMVGPPTEADNDDSRTTCLMAYMSPYAVTNNSSMRSAIEHVIDITINDLGIDKEALHLGGPPVDNVSIDIEGEKTLKTLAGLSGLVGLVLAYLCFRNIRLTGMVLFVAIVSAGASLAMVYYYGAVEVLGFGASTPRLGKIDAILMSMPAVVYVLALSGAIHLVNYYRDAVQEHGRRGAVERAVRMALVPCGLASFTTAIGLASLASSDILPIEKFGVFSAIGVILAVGLLFSMLPVALHRFAPPVEPKPKNSTQTSLPGWARSMAQGICHHHAWVTISAIAVMGVFALGLPRIESSVKLLKLLHPQSDLVQDYTWLEKHLGNLVPMEVVVSVPESLRRGVKDHPEQDGQHYAMTTVQRLGLARRISAQIETLEPVSRTMSAATFAPQPLDTKSPSNRSTYDYIVSEAMDENRKDLSEFLQWEKTTSLDQSPNELWRMSARIAALEDIDYGQFVSQLREAVQPVLEAYQLRDQVVALMATKNEKLSGGRICLVVPENYTTTDSLLADLLREAATTVGAGRLWVTTPDKLVDPSPATQRRLETQQAIVTRYATVAKQLETKGIECSQLVFDHEITANSIKATYTGVVPLVYKTQRELLVSLQESLVLATLLIAGVLVILLRSIGGGLAAMIPNLFPLVVVFGALGWFNIPVDIGIMMTASVALGVAVDDTIHFVSWFRRGLQRGLTRYEAAMEAYERCATAMVQTTLIAGLGLAVFAFSTFTPTEQFGYLMMTILAAALVGDLILLPALLVGPLGALFPAAGGIASLDPLDEGALPTDSSTEESDTDVADEVPAAPVVEPKPISVAIVALEEPVEAKPEPQPTPSPELQPLLVPQAVAKIELEPQQPPRIELTPAPEAAREPELVQEPQAKPEPAVGEPFTKPEPLLAEPVSLGEAVSLDDPVSWEPTHQPHQPLSPANAALRAKLRRFRRDAPQDEAR